MKPQNIEIHRRKKIKSIRLAIKGDLSLHISVPMTYDQNQIKALLIKFAPWIEKSLKKILQTQQKQEDILRAHPQQVPIFGDWREVSEYKSIELLRKILLEMLKERVGHWAAKMQVSPQKISIRSNKKILGSCNYKNDLSFSILLVFAPISLIDSVVIHELAHILHKNHSKKFWDFVGQFCRDHRDARRIFKEQMGLYVLFYEHYYESQKSS
ncbi:M48 family metallopeptidase [Helicobacter mustelae]|uniref:Putative metalloprotease n=1 Tax=Helicobacter mustelae (strain ATCC 43772 / CCUG 25715 / CIP 103759 / LMG 18044 / NCTC 12198 / R85-136P) TaxID=679897 RepID=D3UHJ0_HELM1|nr:SprT family zinc-dependent metalloprotease [Helicobacter mustelae]CBG39962.1 putative metalloprotease [Helicobacter mustelae 12198]SQH71475.1 metalloprotease [Helicobacter mustelae]